MLLDSSTKSFEQEKRHKIRFIKVNHAGIEIHFCMTNGLQCQGSTIASPCFAKRYESIKNDVQWFRKKHFLSMKKKIELGPRHRLLNYKRNKKDSHV